MPFAGFFILRRSLLLPVAFFSVLVQSCHSGQPDDRSLSIFKGKISGCAKEQVEVARFALRHSSNPRVIAFSRMLVADDSSALNKLNEAVPEAAVESPETSRPKSRLHRFSGLSGKAFDQAYVNDQLRISDRLLMIYVSGAQARTGQKYAIAQESMPIMQRHVDSARSIAVSLH